MKKLLFSFLSLLMAMNLAFAGGLVTNTNQSAAWARMLVRDASTSIDAAYFNPAGLTKLSDGFHLSVSNQSIFQERSITNSLYPGEEWKGSVSAPFFPNFYAAYKTGKWAFSFGFTPIGGGGSAKFDNGIPMIEMLVSQLPSAFTSLGANGNYTYNASFEGSSIYLGIQGGISYAINDMISVYLGGRYVMAKNTYTGSITDVSLSSVNPSMPLLTNATLTGAATSYQEGGDNLQTAFDGGTPTATPVSAAEPSGGPISSGLIALGYNPATLDLGTAQTIFYGAAVNLTTGAAYLADKNLDVEQTGSGFTPIIGANLSLMDNKLNIGLKYEFKTNMEVTNNTTQDVMVSPTETMYPDGEIYDADMPAMLSIGVNYKFSDKFSSQIGYHTYFDKKAGWSEIDHPVNTNEKLSLIDNNYWEFGLGFEYKITDKFLASFGLLRATTGVNDYYHDDMSYSLSSNTFGLGGAYMINDMITLNFGGYNTWYTTRTILDPNGGGYLQTYEKSNIAFAIGLDFAFGGK
jgi:long-subunit fatty acid transport protein